MVNRLPRFYLPKTVNGYVLKDTQFLLIDSDLVEPDGENAFDFQSQLLSREAPLISYYNGP